MQNITDGQNGHPSPMTQQEIHDATMVMLKKLIEICDTIDVRYMLAYGTLLGAVRHQGFIPWDDDCDVMLLRPDYEKLIAWCDEHAEEIKPFKVISRKNMPPTYLMTIARFTDTRYRCETNFQHDTGIGLFIDLHPLDGAGNTRDAFMEKAGEERQHVLDILHRATLPQFGKKKGIARFTSFLAWGFNTAIILMGRGKKLLDRLDAMQEVFSLEESEYVGCVIWVTNYHSYKKSCLMETKKLRFEDIEANVPADPDDFLTEQYGDYMTPPPKDKQTFTRHNYRLYRKA